MEPSGLAATCSSTSALLSWRPGKTSGSSTSAPSSTARACSGVSTTVPGGRAVRLGAAAALDHSASGAGWLAAPARLIVGLRTTRRRSQP